ncbi:glycosyltransferase [Frigidibacter sp. MR17.14]|uniref:glycosyltransferase family 2 protein n=1 Tax=Frigidibacter sp. MR17.14 TaxID=3126509 RepID=UPI003012FB59
MPDPQDPVAPSHRRTGPPPERISVVIAHLNQPAMLAACLQAVMAGTRRPDEVIVVDNGSVMPPVEICARHPQVRLIAEPTPGPGPARSTGARAATGTILAFTDADCLPDAGWLAAAERALAEPGVEILGGDVRIACADPARPTMIEAYESIFGFRNQMYIERQNFSVTCNLVTRPATWATVGDFAGLDKAEDNDWGARATAMGYRIRFRPEALVRHPARPDMAALRRKWDRHTGHFYHEARSRRFGRIGWALRMVAMALSPLGELPGILTSDRVRGPRARALAFAGLVRIRLYRAWLMAWLLAGGDPATLAGRWNRAPARG